MKRKNTNIEIPDIHRDISLIKRLVIVVLGGFDSVLDREGQLYFRLLCRLIDKAADEYLTSREYIMEEIKTKDKLAYRFSMIDHLENCINAINRAIKTFTCLNEKRSNILNFVSAEIVSRIKEYSVSNVRNRIEHIDEDILGNKFEGSVFLDINENYSQICINNKCLPFIDLASMIENYHNFVLEIFNNFPNRCEKGIYYYDKK